LLKWGCGTWFFVSQRRVEDMDPAKAVRHPPSTAKIYVCLENLHAKWPINTLGGSMKNGVKRLRNLIETSCVFVVLAAAAAPAQAQGAITTAARSPNPALVGQLSKQLSITPLQATGGAGTLFGLAKSRLSAPEFSKIAAVVPGMNGLLKAAPAAHPLNGGLSGISGLSNGLPGGAGGLVSAATSFQKLGLSPDKVSKFVPILTQFVQSRGGANVASLFSKGLK
jgi:hypothetical protein